EFNNDLIMPYLHYAQILTFHLLGTGLPQDRLLSVLTSLLTLPLLFFPTQRLFDTPTALLATLLWGLSHANFLYNRLALMDTPGAFVLSLGWALWVGGLLAKERQGVWMGLSGLVLGGVYGVRGLGALVWGVPLALLVWERRWRLLAWWSGGLAASLLFYLLWWYLPHYAQIQHMNHYYLTHQLLPHSLRALRENILVNLFGHHRGIAPYLFLHLPIETLLVLLLGIALLVKKERWFKETQTYGLAFLFGWLTVFVLFCTVSSYAPSRYYVLFYPALAVLAAVALQRFHTVVRTVAMHRPSCGLLAGYLGFQIGRPLNLPGRLEDGIPIVLGVCCAGLGFFFIPPPKMLTLPALNTFRILLIGAWALCQVGWTTDWLAHLSYTQKRTSLLLAAMLPKNSVLFGDAAPGLCLFNRFINVPVLPGLCNDSDPLAQYRSHPRYLALLDGRRNLQWWRRKYPTIFQQQPLLQRKVVGFGVVVYAVPTATE
ncbi:MAG TPA: glycosyltransferase family 39 protein, partial [Chthonomonas sp.]|uniref:glycosyltransferase family 39 protein n=1 Tax=Chthonomonas sp. TaxID=2282153 RepID=UPI002B4AC904